MKATMIGLIFFSFWAGFFLCAFFASGKIADLERIIRNLRRRLEK